MATYKNFKTEEHNKDFYNVHETGSYKAVKKEAKFVSTFDKVKEDGRKYAGLWKWCPDLFIDFITPKGSNFKLYFYQRIFLIPFSFSSPSRIPIMHRLAHFILSHRSLILLSVFQCFLVFFVVL